MSHLLYLGLLAVCLVGTAPLEIWLGVRVYRQWRRLVTALVPTVIAFGAWDLYAIHRRQWRYVDHWLIGVRLPGSLPLEELLFFLVVPTCSILTLEAVRVRRPAWTIGDER
jgi:lycopene cyclase domain-containing protein